MKRIRERIFVWQWNDEQKMSRGMKIEQNVCSNENIVWYEKQLKKLI